MSKLKLEQNLVYFSHLDKFGSQDLIPWPSHASPSAPLKKGGETLENVKPVFKSKASNLASIYLPGHNRSERGPDHQQSPGSPIVQRAPGYTIFFFMSKKNSNSYWKVDNK